MPRFFIRPTDLQDGRVILTGENAHHAAYSLRLSPKDRIQVSDGETVYLCALVAFHGETVEAEVLSASPIDTEPPFTVHLYQALPKGDKLDTIIQKAVECGVSAITPFESSRCIVHRKPETEARKTERRARIAEEAAKQSGRGIIPTVSPTVDFPAVLTAAGAADLVLFCYEGEGTRPLRQLLTAVLPTLPQDRAPEIALVIGSEGGFSPEEAAAAAEHGFSMTGLGKRILRTETASGFVLACLVYAFEL